MMAGEAAALRDIVIPDGRIKREGPELGKGAFGSVFQVEYDGKPCAAKQIHSALIHNVTTAELTTLKRNVLHECFLWSTIRHPNVVQFLGTYYPPSADKSSGLPVMIMEKMYESMTSLVKKYDDIPLLVKLSMLHDVSLGLRCLHGRDPPILHRDLSPNNVLVTSYLQAKISDLGVAKAVTTESNKTMTKTPGTTVFMPPEALDDKPSYGPPLDVFSFGGVILHATTRQWPAPKAVKQLDSTAPKRSYIVLSEVERRQQYIDLMTGGDTDLKPLAISCLNDDPELRPTIVDISETLNALKEQCKKKTTRDGMGRIMWLAEITLSPSKKAVISEQLKVCFSCNNVFMVISLLVICIATAAQLRQIEPDQ